MEGKKKSLKDIGYKKLAILFLAGVVLIVFSISEFGKSSQKTETPVVDNINNEVVEAATTSVKATTSSHIEVEYYEEKLADIIKNIKGIQDAQVMVMLEESSEKIVLKDSPYEKETLSEADSSGGTRETEKEVNNESTVIIQDGNGLNTPYITKEIEAKFSGILILVKREDNNVDLKNILCAVESLFGVHAHKITILDMK